jgi:hypothetical protein
VAGGVPVDIDIRQSWRGWGIRRSLAVDNFRSLWITQGAAALAPADVVLDDDGFGVELLSDDFVPESDDDDDEDEAAAVAPASDLVSDLAPDLASDLLSVR